MKNWVNIKHHDFRAEPDRIPRRGLALLTGRFDWPLGRDLVAQKDAAADNRRQEKQEGFVRVH
jgi:hypothetical protein